MFDTPATALSDDALLHLALGGPKRSPARRLADAESLELSAVLVADPVEISTRYGITPARAQRLWALGEVHRRLIHRSAPQRPYLRAPEAVYALMAPRLAGLEIETFWALALDSRSRLIGDPIKLSQGDIDGTEAGPRCFTRAVVRRGAVTAIAVHNHPTGDPSPSAADLAVTTRLCAAGKTVDIPLVDHVVIGHGAWCSLRRDHARCFA
ncbi:MAG: hypothetical protein EA402_02915 [Planctomycetota bacterium]|nr:MAG: hypothetical protein EA402_02915 [Planctomycetota bacterium]